MTTTFVLSCTRVSGACVRVHYTRISYTRVRVCKCIYESIFDIISCEVRDGRCAEREKNKLRHWLLIGLVRICTSSMCVCVCVCVQSDRCDLCVLQYIKGLCSLVHCSIRTHTHPDELDVVRVIMNS